MRVVLEVISGPQLGRKAVLHTGQAAKFGRTERADFAYPDDNHFSSLHFLVQCYPARCLLRDLGSANGTFINGQPTTETVLNDGDVVRAGQTSFKVQIEAAAPDTGPIPASLPGSVPPDAPGGAKLEPPSRETSVPPEIAPLPSDGQLQPLPPPVPPPAASYLPVAPQSASPPPTAVPETDLAPSLSGPSRLVLEVVAGPHAGRRFALRAGETMKVGRTDLADLPLPQDTGLSGLHFAVFCGQAGCALHDLGSSNGTTLNGNAVTEATLSNGDEIRAGESRFKVRLEGAAAAPSPGAQAVAAISFPEGLEDEDPEVRRQVLFTAAWARQSWLLEHCRKQADNPAPENWDAILMLAILGRPGELRRIEAVGRAAQLGPRRFRALGAYGHPASVEFLLEAMASADPATAAAAGAAFKKITGADVASDRRAQVLPEDGHQPDEFEKEFLDEVKMPDPRRARAHWDQVKERFSASTRVCRGIDLSEGAGAESAAELDMESRWEACVRGRFYGTWRGNLRDLESP